MTLRDVFPTADELLAVEPEELGLVILQQYQEHQNNGIFHVGNYHHPLFRLHDGAGFYNQRDSDKVRHAIAEAFAALETFGLIVEDPGQPNSPWRRLTRRAQRALEQNRDLASFKRAHLLPRDLLQAALVEAVYPLFLRGTYDTAVFEAFRQVEVAVRETSNRRNGNAFPDDLVGTVLMRRAFNPENGPLTDMNLPGAEREADANMFAGAIGHAKNPPGHRDLQLTALQAARLIVHASYLLNIVERRGPP